MSLKIPIRKLLKRDIVWLAEHYCRHKHTYLEHYSCFLSEKPDTSPMREKIGIFDIETTGLRANWSHMLTWCMLDRDTGDIQHDIVTTKEARDKEDARIVKSAVKAIEEYDRVVTFYGSQFDIPYVRSRALYHGLGFPSYKTLYHTDVYYVVRNKFALHSNRLMSVCQFFGIPAKDHPMTPKLWKDAGAGKPEALATVLQHCKEDVISTNEVFSLILDHMAQQKRSI
ncbi:MAG: ribonuclease H-like domain-containing protein [Deltaproteobacteria bacterium]|nr:ribonuclease H-like domain-containing protein [Deltaproteobacteria bacterium]